ncbi:MAG: hypothetical protein KJ077_19930 [Anaerolineae bacterium]|nr:hypothetical protein [Anaerolineae bacterium]
MEEEEDRFQQLSGSSKNALAWAFTRARQRVSAKKSAPELVSAVDLLVGILLSHPDSSGPFQLLQHFQLPPKLFYEMLRKTDGFAPDNAPSSPEHLDRVPPLDKEGEHILDESFTLSEQFNQETPRLVRLRDLFGGILATPNQARDLLEQSLSNAGAPFEDLVATYPEFLHYSSREMPFSKFLAEQFPSQKPSERKEPEVSPPAGSDKSGSNTGTGTGPVPPQTPSERKETEAPVALRFAVSGFSADTRTEKDLIGIGAEVDAFAYLIAAKALQPPMAIGLFGDWGSGKSFFMEALRQRIHKITADAQQSGQPQGQISIHKYIAQIEFNAWHYVEGELWASLVEHIFRNLKTRPEDEPTLLQQRQQRVIDKLEVARRAQQVAQVRKAELEQELSEAQDRVIELEKEREAALKNLNDLKARDVLEAVQLSAEERKVISQTFEKLGVTKTYDSAAELLQGANELREVLQRGNALTTPLRERGWKWAAALICVTLIGPVISLALSRIGEVPSVTNALASVSAFLTGLTILLKQGTSWLSGALDRVERAQLQLDAKRREAEAKFASEIAEAERKYNEKAAEYEQAKNEEKAKEQEIAELEQELKQITPGRVLLDFISERVGSQDYRKHLGIAALIRSDFEQLSKLIADENKDFGEKDDGTVRDEDQHLVNRIVLYIDDLDRCPPDRVVQVLQAVHLLLAFPLFVVVVAVDARWLSQSLQAHYQNLLMAAHRRDGLELSEGFGRMASPQDYLEKIFQIPFWVRPLPDKARIRIVQGLVAESMVSPSAESMEGDKMQSGTGQNGKSDQGITKVEGERTTVHGEASERRRPLNLSAETDLKPQGLDIEAIELEFMDELRSLLGETPRSVKRFVNVYRLIKAVSLDQMAKFVEDKPDADFKLVLFLLAVLTGLPAISREFFRLLRAERTETEQAQTPDQQASVPTGRTLAQVLEALRGIISGSPVSSVMAGQGTSATLELAGDGHINGQGDGNWYAARDLDRLETWLKQYDHGSWLHFDATALADWTPQVARYSYRIEEL